VKDLEIKVGNSSHGMAKKIKAMGLDSVKPFMMQTTDSFKARLNAGCPVADWPTPPLEYPPREGDGIAEGL
jgi:hypothetical protein